MPALTTSRRPSARPTRQTGWARDTSSTRARDAPISSRTPTSSSAATGAGTCDRVRGDRAGDAAAPEGAAAFVGIDSALERALAVRVIAPVLAVPGRAGLLVGRGRDRSPPGGDLDRAPRRTDGRGTAPPRLHRLQDEAGRLGDGPRAVVEQGPRVRPVNVPRTRLDVLARTTRTLRTTITLGAGRGHRLTELGHRRGVPGLVAGLVARPGSLVTARGGLAEHAVRVVAHRCPPMDRLGRHRPDRGGEGGGRAGHRDRRAGDRHGRADRR